MAEILVMERAARGWQQLSPEANLQAAETYVLILDRHKVPANQYHALYHRFIDHRVKQIQNGQQPATLMPESLLAEWVGQNGLRSRQLEAEKVERDPMDPYECKICQDTGWEYVRDGRSGGVRRCECRLEVSNHD